MVGKLVVIILSITIESHRTSLDEIASALRPRTDTSGGGAQVWFSPSSLRSFFAGKLTPERKVWFSKTRHGEQPWQRSFDFSKRDRTWLDSGDQLTNYDARVEQQQSLDAVREILAANGIDFVELPSLSNFGPTLVVDREYTDTVCTSLLEELPNRATAERAGTWTISLRNVRGAKLTAKASKRNPGKVGSVTCLHHRYAPNGRELTTHAQSISIELWRKSSGNDSRADGGKHIAGTLLRRQTEPPLTLDYVEATTWDSAQRNSGKIRLPAPHLRVLQDPIDVVYTWVDGSDPDWRARMLTTLRGADLTAAEPSSISESRYTSHDELRYSLRSLEYYASWVRRIFIVTDGQAPEWLDTDNPKITVVDHREIFADPKVLPVFNSHAIESQLHHIPGLADRYLYLNDDCFFLRPTEPELFFTANGLAKHFPSQVPIDFGDWGQRDLPIISAAKRGRDHIMDKYGRTVTHRFKHTPHAQLRQVLEEMESEEPQLFAQVAASPFRSPEDVSIPSSLHHFDAFARGMSIVGKIGYQFVDLSEPDLELRLLRVARRTDLDVFCLNETTVPDESRENASKLVGRFFEDRFPIPSSFELG